MQFFIFIIILVAVIYLMSRVKLHHLNDLPEEQKNIMLNKEILRSALIKNHIKITSGQDMKQYFPLVTQKDLKKIINEIRDKEIEDKYHFNMANKPIQKRNPQKQPSPRDIKYIRYIREGMDNWGKPLIVENIILKDIIETEEEFMIRVLAKILFWNEVYDLSLLWYGRILPPDDIFTKQQDPYKLFLLNIKLVSK
jgi:hypothetical protein